jgi:hypothetical protein
VLLALLAFVIQPTVDEASTYLAGRTSDPSAVRFRNVRLARDVVCGEISDPNLPGHPNAFLPFAFHSPMNWISGYEETEAVANRPGQEMTGAELVMSALVAACREPLIDEEPVDSSSALERKRDRRDIRARAR